MVYPREGGSGTYCPQSQTEIDYTISLALRKRRFLIRRVDKSDVQAKDRGAKPRPRRHLVSDCGRAGRFVSHIAHMNCVLLCGAFSVRFGSFGRFFVDSLFLSSILFSTLVVNSLAFHLASPSAVDFILPAQSPHSEFSFCLMHWPPVQSTRLGLGWLHPPANGTPRYLLQAVMVTRVIFPYSIRL